MEVLKLSKFKLQLRALVTEVRQLREREHSGSEQLHISIQKQKQTEEECGRKLSELQAELAVSNEIRQKLERKVSCLQNDNTLLQNKQNELKGTINSLLQSRESFIKAYEDSTCEMKRSIESRDRKLALLHEKINSHLSLFDSIEKEAFSVKQVVDNVQCLLSEKEEIVAGLKCKMEKVSAIEKVFVENISHLESKLKKDESEIHRKDRIILGLEAQLEAAKISNNCQPQIEELQLTLSAKEVIIENLISEKKALHFEVRNLGIILQKIQDTVTNMNAEDKRAFLSVIGGEREPSTSTEKENYRIEDVVCTSRENAPHNASGIGTEENTASSQREEYNSVNNQLQENNNFCSRISEFGCSPPRPTCSEPQSAANELSISGTKAEDNCRRVVYHPDSESSTCQAEMSKDLG